MTRGNVTGSGMGDASWSYGDAASLWLWGCVLVRSRHWTPSMRTVSSEDQWSNGRWCVLQLVVRYWSVLCSTVQRVECGGCVAMVQHGGHCTQHCSQHD